MDFVVTSECVFHGERLSEGAVLKDVPQPDADWLKSANVAKPARQPPKRKNKVGDSDGSDPVES